MADPMVGTTGRHTASSRARSGGFSFVELLVTILIAGIAFAALVPMFVGAQQKNAADLFRQAGLNAAQDRIERVRSLDFASITQSNLVSTFGTTAPVSANPARQLAVGYSVINKPSDTNIKYKLVTVTVSWTAPPQPVKAVVLQTVVYRQYAGPTLATFWTDPGLSEDNVLGGASLTTVKVSAIPTQPWRGQQTQSVQFQIYDSNGNFVTAQLVYNTSIPGYSTKNGTAPCGFDSSTSTFWWNWDSSGVLDGTYSVTATPAAAGAGSYLGATDRFFFVLARNITTAAPTGLTVTPGVTQASLTWAAVPTAASYKVYRATSAGGPFTLVGAPATPQLTDSPLVSSTDYWYEVSSVNASGVESARCSPVKTTTLAPTGDTTPPTAPTWGSITHDVVGAGVIQLTWNASTDTGTGVKDYQVWRSADGSNWGTQPLATTADAVTLTYNDSVGAGKTYYYRVTARDVALNVSDPSTVQSATTNTPTTTFTLTVTNAKNPALYVWLSNVGNTLYYSQSGSTSPTPSATGTALAGYASILFSGLPNGNYNVWVYSKTPLNTSKATAYGVTINNANASVSVQ